MPDDLGKEEALPLERSRTRRCGVLAEKMQEHLGANRHRRGIGAERICRLPPGIGARPGDRKVERARARAASRSVSQGEQPCKRLKLQTPARRLIGIFAPCRAFGKRPGLVPQQCKLAVGCNRAYPHAEQFAACRGIVDSDASASLSSNWPSRCDPETVAGRIGAPLQAFQCLYRENRRRPEYPLPECPRGEGLSPTETSSGVTRLEGAVARTQLEAEIDRCRVRGGESSRVNRLVCR